MTRLPVRPFAASIDFFRRPFPVPGTFSPLFFKRSAAQRMTSVRREAFFSYFLPFSFQTFILLKSCIIHLFSGTFSCAAAPRPSPFFPSIRKKRRIFHSHLFSFFQSTV